MEKEMIQQLWKQYYPKMYSVARAILGDEQTCKDAVSDIFERLLHGNITVMPDTEEHYLLTCVRNQCLKCLRHKEVERQLTAPYSQAPVEDLQDEDDRLTDIIEIATSHLSEQEHRIFNLRFTNGCSYEEIAMAEGISKVAVWKHLSHAITLIKNKLITY